MKEKITKNILFFFLFIYNILLSQPVTEWVQRYNSTENYNDYVNDMAVDGQGNVYLTGYSNANFLTIKYNTAGEIKWVKTYDGPYHGYDKAIAIALDKNNNVYVFGQSVNIYGKELYAFVKYSIDGEQLWVREFINSDSIGAYPYAFAVDDSGNVYGTGYCSFPANTDFCTVKYNSIGVFQWVKFFGGTANIGDIPYSITTDKNGNSFVTGYIRDSGNINPLTTVKYDCNGNFKWVNKYYGINNAGGVGTKINTDLQGNVFVAGRGTSGTGTKSEFILIKYDTSGNEKWARRYHCLTASNGNAYISDMVVDNNNNIYITGLNDSNQNGWDFTTLKYNNNGDWLWIKRYKKAFNSSDDVNAITVDRFNNVYVTGGTDNNTPWYQFLTVKYSSDGTFNWAMTYNNNTPLYYNHKAIKVKTDSSGNVFVTGNSEGNGTGMDIATIKYTGPSGIINITNEIPTEFKLFQNYPNPFNQTTKIKYQITNKENRKIENDLISITVFDLLGREISSLVNEKQKAGVYEVIFYSGNLSTGIYFYRLIINGDIIDTKKLVLIK